jgi:hypothetical protein
MSQQPTAEKPQTPAPKIPNPFSFDPPPRAAQLTRQNDTQHQKRTGLVPLAIGASRVVRAKDGQKRQFAAKERIHEVARAERDERKLTMACVCFECKATFASYDELSKDERHTDSLQMKEAQESHTWAYWCEDNVDPKGKENIEALSNELRALDKAHRSCIEGIAKLDDVEKIMAERKRAENIKTMIDETQKKKNAAIDNIIGLLSDTPPAV